MLFSLFWLIWPLLYATGALGIGAVAVANEAVIAHLVTIMAGCLFPLRGIWYFVLAKRNGKKIQLKMTVQTAIECAVALAFVFLPRLSYQGFLVVFFLFLSFYTAVQGINSWIYLKNQVHQYFVPSVCQCLLFLHLMLGIVVLPGELRYRLVFSGAGFFLSILGQSYLLEWLSTVIQYKPIALLFHKIAITMPGFSGLGVPTRLIGALQDDSYCGPLDAEILFSYGKDGGIGIAGHCELCVNGYTYTYGNYDPDSRTILQTVGDGILFRAPRQEYIAFLRSQGKTVISYGLRFDRVQRKYFQHTLALFHKVLIPWEKKASQVSCQEYIFQIQKEMDLEIFRIDKGRFKTYFLPTINCVTLTGSLLRGTAAGNIVIPGVYTPGNYMDALQHLYVAGNSVVVSVKIY